jgi:magnesium transporter
MTPDFIAVREDWIVQEVLDYIRAYGRDSETLNVIYVVDDGGKLIDDIRMREFLLRPLTSPVRDLMQKTFITLNVTDSQRDALNIFRKYDRSVLPVIDSTGVLLGIVTVDDMLDVAEQEATEEFQKFGGMEALEEPYMRIPLWRMVRKRAGWLIILFLGEMLTATAMANYQEELAKALVLALFLPLIVSSGGNSGSQASTLMIRAMALGEVTLRDWWRVMGREVQAGLALGAILGVIGVVRVAIWAIVGEQYLHRQPYGPHWPLVALTVGISLVGVVIWGTLSGSMLPFLLRRIGADPATSSAPFVATLVDVTGLIIYFSIALVIMRGVML